MTKDSPHDTHHELDRETIALIDATAADIRANIDNGRLPKIKLPARSLNNVDYDKTKGYFELGSSCKVRSLNVNTARSFAQTLRLMATSRSMVENDDFATKREAYYISKNWGHCRFDNQSSRMPPWTTSRPWHRCMACHASSCASTPSPTAARSRVG